MKRKSKGSFKTMKFECKVVDIKSDNLVKKILMFLNLMRKFRNADDRASLMAAIARAGKVGLGAGAAYGLIVTLGILSEDQTSELLTVIFTLVPAQVIVAGFSKWLKERFGITLPI